jgi:uncharacterized protein with HEPN domain
MDERILKWLYDIKLSIEEIEGYFENEEKNFFQYQKNIMLKRAIERNLEIIGEALNRILKKEPFYENQISNAKSIISLRNLVIHAYDSISDENIWSILTIHLPLLKSEINGLISNNNN